MGYLQCRKLSPGYKENGRIRNQAEIIFWFVKNILPYCFHYSIHLSILVVIKESTIPWK